MFSMHAPDSVAYKPCIKIKYNKNYFEESTKKELYGYY